MRDHELHRSNTTIFNTIVKIKTFGITFISEGRDTSIQTIRQRYQEENRKDPVVKVDWNFMIDWIDSSFCFEVLVLFDIMRKPTKNSGPTSALLRGFFDER